MNEGGATAAIARAFRRRARHSLAMGRLHLFELEDQRWFPAVLRDAGTSYLRFMQEKSGQATAFAPLLAQTLRAAGTTRIVDLCSGGAGPVVALVEALAKDGLEVQATLTDVFPNVAALELARAQSGGRVTFESAPVDATSVPGRLLGLRTLFNAFHHFRPAMARQILQDAVDARQPVAVVEVVRRSPLALLGILFSPLLALLVVPLLRPFRWTWVPLTYLVPVIPFFILWDGVVSCLRVYSPAELRALVAGLKAEGWTWQTGELPLRGAPIPATYLVGLPPRPSG